MYSATASATYSATYSATSSGTGNTLEEAINNANNAALDAAKNAQTNCFPNISQEAIFDLLKDNVKLIKLCNAERETLTYPKQSNFRVVTYIIFSYYNNFNRQLGLINGSNIEEGYIGGAICSERAALSKLRFFKNVIILKLAVVTDSNIASTPGTLCREFIYSFADGDLPIVYGNDNSTEIISIKLSELWPYPYLYRYNDRYNVVSFANEIVKNLVEPTSNYTEIYNEAKSVSTTNPKYDLFPITYGAAVLYDDNSIDSAWFLPAFEYGSSLDPITQLIKNMEQNKIKNVLPLYIIMTDQFGVCHSPFAQSRALLVEYGYENLKIGITLLDGTFNETTMKDLYPYNFDF